MNRNNNQIPAHVPIPNCFRAPAFARINVPAQPQYVQPQQHVQPQRGQVQYFAPQVQYVPAQPQYAHPKPQYAAPVQYAAPKPQRAPQVSHSCQCKVCKANPRCKGAGVIFIMDYNTAVNPTFAASCGKKTCRVVFFGQENEYHKSYAKQYNLACGKIELKQGVHGQINQKECICFAAQREGFEEHKIREVITENTQYIVHHTTVIFIVKVSSFSRTTLNKQILVDKQNPHLDACHKEIDHIDCFQVDHFQPRPFHVGPHIQNQIENKPVLVSDFAHAVIANNRNRLLSF